MVSVCTCWLESCQENSEINLSLATDIKHDLSRTLAPAALSHTPWTVCHNLKLQRANNTRMELRRWATAGKDDAHCSTWFVTRTASALPASVFAPTNDARCAQPNPAHDQAILCPRKAAAVVCDGLARDSAARRVFRLPERGPRDNTPFCNLGTKAPAGNRFRPVRAIAEPRRTKPPVGPRVERQAQPFALLSASLFPLHWLGHTLHAPNGRNRLAGLPDAVRVGGRGRGVKHSAAARDTVPRVMARRQHATPCQGPAAVQPRGRGTALALASWQRIARARSGIGLREARR